MKIRTVPKEYDAIKFKNDIEVCHAIQDFISGHSATLICETDRKILSTVIGNTVLEDGDIIYKCSSLLVGVIKKNESFDKYFEMVE